MKKLKVSILGAGARGRVLAGAISACDNAELVSMCDPKEYKLNEVLDFVKKHHGIEPKAYTDHRRVLESGVDVVIVATDWEHHTELCIECMEKGIIPAVEVYGAYDIEECWELVRAYERTGVPLAFLENCCFDRFELLCTAMHRRGMFGDVVYCHGAYRHNLARDLVNYKGERANYRGLEYYLRNCETYPTHELGPIAKLLNINRGNKMLYLTTCASKPGAGLREYAMMEGVLKDKTSALDFKSADIFNTNIVCTGGELINIVLDTTLPTYYDREFTVRGTKGMALQTANLVVFEGKEYSLEEFYEPEKSIAKHMNSANEFNELLPDCWRNLTDEERKLGHGGMDYIQMHTVFDAIIKGREMPLDVYDCASLISITPLSEQSVAHGGLPQAIPDFTRGKWLRRKKSDVMPL